MNEGFDVLLSQPIKSNSDLRLETNKLRSGPQKNHVLRHILIYLWPYTTLAKRHKLILPGAIRFWNKIPPWDMFRKLRHSCSSEQAKQEH